MALTSNPFHPVTNALLPGYRDAYLRGDLSRTNTELVDAYLQANAAVGDDTFRRFHKLRALGHRVRPVGWVGQQLRRLHTAPARFRQRAAGLLLAGLCVSGMVLAGTGGLPALGLSGGTGAGLFGGDDAKAAVAATITLHGQVLDENGAPLVGATVLDKSSGRGVSTNAEGKYALQVAADGIARLQYGFGGYQEEEVVTQRQRVQNIVLLPNTDQKASQRKKHWWNR